MVEEKVNGPESRRDGILKISHMFGSFRTGEFFSIEMMTSSDFKNIVDQLITVHGFKRKGNRWFSQTIELEKIIELQK